MRGLDVNSQPQLGGAYVAYILVLWGIRGFDEFDLYMMMMMTAVVVVVVVMMMTTTTTTTTTMMMMMMVNHHYNV